MSRLTPLPFSWATVTIAVVFALLPDADFILHAFRRGADEFSHEHRDLFHNPLLFVPIGSAAIAYFNVDLAYLFALCTLAHFLHDSIGMGWGIRWAYPFSDRYYKFFSDKQGRMSSNVLVSWTSEEQRQAAVCFGNPHWLKDYLKFSPELLWELLVFTAALITLALVK